MCTVSYEKMESDGEHISIFRRIRKIDYRVWFFMFVAGSNAFDITKLEYLVQYGFTINTFHIPLYLIFNAYLMYAAISNNLIAMTTAKFYTALFLMVSTIIATLAPVWMIFEFKNGAPEHIRQIMEHGETYQMEFLQRLGYCLLLETTLILDAIYYAIGMYLSQKVIQLVKTEQKEVPLEMNSFNYI